jgi:hypothetical protein
LSLLLRRLSLLRWLLGLLLPWLSGLRALLGRLLLLMFLPCPRLSLRALVLRGGRRAWLRLALLRFGLALPFILLLVLRIRRDHHPEKQKQGSRTGNSNELHNHSPL